MHPESCQAPRGDYACSRYCHGGAKYLKLKVLLAISAASFVPAGNVAAQETGASLAIKFGALESVLDISLSPSGKTLLYVSPLSGGGRGVFVYDLGAGGDPRRITQARPGS